VSSCTSWSALGASFCAATNHAENNKLATDTRRMVVVSDLGTPGVCSGLFFGELRADQPYKEMQGSAS